MQMKMIFFKHESSRDPPSLSDRGTLYRGTKSDLMDCIPGVPKLGRNPDFKNVNIKLFDMAAVIHMLKPGIHAVILGNLADVHLISFLINHINAIVTRIEGLWDTYRTDSIEINARRKRGQRVN